MSFSVNRCSEGIEDENTQEGQAAGLYCNHTHAHIRKVGHYKTTCADSCFDTKESMIFKIQSRLSLDFGCIYKPFNSLNVSCTLMLL